MLKIYLCLSLLFLAHSSTEYLPRGMKLKWYFPQIDSVTFEFWAPQPTLEPYQWVGLAMQDSRDSRDHFRCDYYIAMLVEGGVLDDRYSEINGLPPLDNESGGTNDLTSSRTTVDEYEVFVFTRLLVTGDALDVDLVYGRPVMLKWVLGNLDSEGNIQQHTMDDMGFEYFVLTDNYEDRNHDERWKYGPYLELPLTVDFMDPEVVPEDPNALSGPDDSSVGEYASRGALI